MQLERRALCRFPNHEAYIYMKLGGRAKQSTNKVTTVEGESWVVIGSSFKEVKL